MFEKSERELLTNFLMRIHNRRQQYLYAGIQRVSGHYLLGSHVEGDFKFGDPEQCVALINITDEAANEVVQKFLGFFKVDNPPCPYIVTLRHLFSVVSKEKWSLDNLVVYDDEETGVKAVAVKDENGEPGPAVVYAHPFESHFTCIRLLGLIAPLRKGLEVDAKSVDIPLDGKVLPIDPVSINTASAVKVVLTSNMFEGSPLSKYFEKRTRPLILTRGRDLLTPKTLVEKQPDDFKYTYALRIWNPAGRELCFACRFSMPGYEIICGRVNLFLI